jgi:amino acid adenylation domain-containing protein
MLLNIIDYIEKRSLQKFAEKTAVIDGDKETSFVNLVQAAKLLAIEIISIKDFVNKPIAVFLPKSTESVIANLAITYSGNIYMNLDIKNPDSRIKNILEKIQPEVIITSRQLSQRVEAIAGRTSLFLYIDDKGGSTEPNEKLIFDRLEKIIDTDPYCIINTSGSTGTPKGVVLNHKSFIDFTEWAVDVLKIGDDEIIGSLSPLYFDIYSFELCLLMAKGATIVIIPESLATFPAKLIEFLKAKKVNWIFWVPTIMVNISNLDLFASYQLPDLRTIWFAGEVFPTKHLNYWRRYLPQAKFVNLYGPIEITLDCTYYVVENDLPDDTPIPIGYPCRNTDVLILNDDNEIAALNEKGELCVRGTSLAMGYYNDPEKTAKAFVQNPLNKSYPEVIYRTGDVVYKNEKGEIIFAGRKDYQVKHLGYRIDLGEVEHVIVNTWGGIPNACVLYNHDKKEICLFYEGKSELSPAEFRKDLIQYLPKYMVPTHYRFFAELPRNPNGKIDRNLLATMLRNEVSA